jgi:hypothetical protein
MKRTVSRYRDIARGGQSAHDVDAAGHRGHRCHTPASPACALRRTTRRAGGEHRRSGARSGHQPRTGGANLCLLH